MCFNRTMPQHTSRLCKGYLTKKESDGVLHQMIWLPQSLDLNPFEMFWDELDHRVKEKQPTRSKHMLEFLQDCWKSNFFVTRLFQMSYFIVLMSSLLFYNVENSKD